MMVNYTENCPRLRQVVEVSINRVAVIPSHPRWVFARLIKNLYEALRVLAGSQKPSDGTSQILNEIVNQTERLEGDFHWHGDMLAMHYAYHFGSLAKAGLGQVQTMRKINRLIREYLRGACPATWNQEDYTFVRLTVFLTLIDHDPEFAKSVSLEELRARVDEIENGEYPDFPGRALQFAQHLSTISDQKGDLILSQEAIDLLGRGAGAPFGNIEQRLQCQECLMTIVDDLGKDPEAYATVDEVDE